MKNIVIKYGFISGAILVGMVCTMMVMMSDTTHFEKGESFGYLFMIGAFSMIFFGIREYRDKITGGLISFNKAFRVGILIALIASVLYVTGWMIYFNFIDTTFVEKYTTYFTEKIQASDKPQTEIDKEISAFKINMANYKNPFVMIMYTFLEVFPIGLIITVLCAMLMRKRSAQVPLNAD